MIRKKIVGIISFVCALTLAVGCIGTHVAKNQASINKVFDVVRTVESAQVDKLQDLLTDYTVDNNIKETVKNFLQQTRVHEIDTFVIQESAAGVPQEGQSGDQLFFINDKQGKLISVVKVFGKPFEPRGNFIKELTGFELLSKTVGKNFNLVTAKAIGKSAIDGSAYGMLAISPADGINMQTLVIEILRSPRGTVKRSDALYTAQQGITTLGSALAEFHQIRTQKDMPLDPAIYERLHGEMNQVIAYLEKENPGIDIQLLQDYAASLVQEMNKIKTTRSMVHGDAHLGNFLYDPKTGTVSIVDYNELKRSVNAKGNPVGNSALDYMSMADIIAGNKNFGLTQEESSILNEAFIKGYGTPPSKLEQDFFALLYRLSFIAWFWKAEEANPESFADGKIRKIVIYMVDALKDSLRLYCSVQDPAAGGMSSLNNKANAS